MPYRNTTEAPQPPLTALPLQTAPPCHEALRIQRLDLAVVIPTYNERENIAELINKLDIALCGLAWEAVFVDDDSPDRTSDLLREIGRLDPRIRLVHRIGRRGLSSACIEGILSTSANAIAVMDADMQHDETILPRMLSSLRRGSLDLVIATRNAEGGSMGQFGRERVLLSRLGRGISRTVCQCEITDPMSGFFLVSRDFFSEVVHRLHRGGFKILVDMLSSATDPVRFAEVGYTFRTRRHGQSKLDASIAIDYLLLVLGKLAGRLVPVRFASFALVGSAGVATHLACLALLTSVFHERFVTAQIIATYIAMTENFFFNNLITWHDNQLRGARLYTGLASFWFACSFGAWANILFARELLHAGTHWYVAGAAGIMIGSVWNYCVSNLFTWQNAQPAWDELEAGNYVPDLSN